LTRSKAQRVVPRGDPRSDVSVLIAPCRRIDGQLRRYRTLAARERSPGPNAPHESFEGSGARDALVGFG
jgi:hypothetical protein